ncbi:unnamed protein product [Angiostrongylus costaricensis]|uniref:Metalloendopeptidase n=1 Tax=Angiostrongylus costaricensis TaxID=334426 RepID=A0A0R3PXN0_ANGCS|nr:unnamed protein product [Angiostrongylus costaricensis]
MRVLLLAYVAVFVNSEKSFEEKLKEGNQLLKNSPNADDTMEFLQKIHSMEKQMKEEYSAKPNAEELKAIEEYAKIEPSDMGVSIASVNRDSKVGNALFQGDIILTKQQADEILEDISENKGNRKKRQAYRDGNYPKTLWSQGINYVFWNATQSARRVFRKAAVIWSENTCLNFKEDNSGKQSKHRRLFNCSEFNERLEVKFLAKDKVYVIHGAGCWSHVGRIGGSQILSLGDRCDHIGLGLHELGHTIGLFHTQSRHDRDDFITLHFENLIDGWEDQFTKESERTNHNYNITYDYGTVMHYGATALPPGCGKKLTATNEYQELWDVVGQKNYDRYSANDEFYFCNYWIEGPAGSTIEVIFQNYTENLAYDGCVWAGVEIKTLADQRLTGYRSHLPRFCSPDYGGTSLISTRNVVPVITFSRLYEVTSLLRYRIASSGPATSKTTPEPTSGQTRRPTSQQTLLPSSQSTPQTSSEGTPGPTSKPKKLCYERKLCQILVKLGLCDSSLYTVELKQQVCPNSCA